MRFTSRTSLEDGMQLLTSVLLRSGGIVHELASTTARDALAELVSKLPVPATTDRAVLLRALEAREAKGSTAVGDGIAMPHTRESNALQVEQPFVTLCFLRHGIDFDAADGTLVRTLFMIAAPSADLHVRILGQLGAMLRDPPLRALLRRQASAGEIIARIEALEADHADHVQSRISGASSK